MLSDLQFLVLHELSWFQLLDYALISKAHLRLVQSYLKCYPKRINHYYVFERLLPYSPRDRSLWDYSLLNGNYEIITQETRAPSSSNPLWSYELLSNESPEDFWSGPNMAWYRRLLGLKVPTSCDAK
jgi:hypothetical protein